MIFTDDLNGILSRIENGADAASLLTVTLRRLAVLIANREDGPELLEGFKDAFYRELSNVRWRKQLELVMRGPRPEPVPFDITQDRLSVVEGLIEGKN